MPVEEVVECVSYLKEKHGFDVLVSITGVDWKEKDCFELIYHLTQSQNVKIILVIRVRLPRKDDVEAVSLFPVYLGADWQEREIYDLYGVRFKGHPRLKRILLWENYPGWPLRKDYVHTRDKYDSGEEVGLSKSSEGEK